MAIGLLVRGVAKALAKRKLKTYKAAKELPPPKKGVGKAKTAREEKEVKGEVVTDRLPEPKSEAKEKAKKRGLSTATAATALTGSALVKDKAEENKTPNVETTGKSTKIKAEKKDKPIKPADKPKAPAGKEDSFGSAFAAARKAGKKEFSWKGKKYHTRTREEEKNKKQTESRKKFEKSYL